jgi:hypothetical protein
MPPLSAAEPGTAAGQGHVAGSRIAADLSSADATDSSTRWTAVTWAGLAALAVLWGWEFYSTWAAWGNLTIDSGHEMYVPAMLAQEKKLYRDVWFLYGPAAPYFNSWLFRIFGPRLNVLYWAGSLSALGTAIFLYLAGVRLSLWHAGWTAGAVVLLEAFEPSLFCFPLPYSYSTVYACLVTCFFVWAVIEASRSGGWMWMFGAGTAAAAALLLKMEFGVACYATLALMLAARCLSERTWRPLGTGIAASLPGVAGCALVIRWMVSIAGVEFITQENIMSWPTSYFMRTYGKMWLATTGFTMSSSVIEDIVSRAVPLAGAAMLVWAMLWWKRSDAMSNVLRGALALCLLTLLLRRHFNSFRELEPAVRDIFAALFFPRDMVLYVAAAAPVAWWRFLRRPGAQQALATALVLSCSALVAFRILTGMEASKYPIYYNGPVVLSFLAVAFQLIPRAGHTRRFVFMGELAICLGCLTAVFGWTRLQESYGKYYVALKTERGTIRTSKDKAENYEAAIRFMKEKASQGEYVLSVPEDTSLYFLSETECPTRLFAFTPGALVPGKMTEETIRQMEQKHVRYLIWSNRIFPEYGAPVFGVDFDREFGEYLKSHYRPIGRLLPRTPFLWEWTAVKWERKNEQETP